MHYLQLLSIGKDNFIAVENALFEILFYSSKEKFIVVEKHFFIFEG